MKKLLTLVFAMLATLMTTAQTFNAGYYHILVLRQYSYIYANSGYLVQDVYYNLPTSYTADDMAYVFKFEPVKTGGFKIRNCQSNNYIALNEAGFLSQPLPESTDAAIFMPVRTPEGYYGLRLLSEEGVEYQAFLNDLAGRYLCLWDEGPEKDAGSCFLLVSVDESLIKQFLNETGGGDNGGSGDNGNGNGDNGGNGNEEKPGDQNPTFGDDQSTQLWGAATDTIAVQNNDGIILVPNNMIEAIDKNNGTTKITLKGGKNTVSGYVVETPRIDDSYPMFRTFKFNNKYNDILVSDVNGEIGDNEVKVDVTSCIGKTLCPSFSLTNEEATVYCNNERQLSHANRIRFDKPVIYTIAKPGYKIMQVIKTKDEVWSNPSNDGEEIRVELTVDMLSTNAPSGRGQGLENLVDGNNSTFYHSTWSNDPLYDVLPTDQYPYIQIDLKRVLRYFKLCYTIASDNSNRSPLAADIQVSNDGKTWKTVASLYDLPTYPSAEFASATIDAGNNIKYIRFQETAAAYKNYLKLAEMSLYEIRPNDGEHKEPELLEPAEYEYSTRRWGRDVKVNATFATDRSQNVPRIDINLSDGYTLQDIHWNKTVYHPGMFSIDGAGVFPDMEPVEVNMRGRGNSSWSASKKPYRLKFNSKQKPFGLKKGKSWVLIAQAQTGSLLTNPIAQRVATMTGTPGANHCIPVELYVNGVYIGSYMFTENPGLGSNSVDIDETNAYALELDTYYDEDYRFQDEYYYLPVNIKDPDLTEVEDYEKVYNTLDLIKNQFNDFAKAVYQRDADKYEEMMDIDSWSRFMLVNDVVRNTELMWPKSVKLFKVDMTNEDDKLVWGPCWDYDWAFGYENNRNYYIAKAEDDLLQTVNYTASNPYYPNNEKHGAFFYDIQRNSEVLGADRYRVWTEFMNIYRDELIDYVDDYLAYAKPSFLNNSYRWGDGRDYTQNAENAKAWLKKRTDWVYNNMRVYDLPAVTYGKGDVNQDGSVSVGDAICVVNKILGKPNDFYNENNADMNGDGKITIGDVQLIIRAILDAEAKSASMRSRMPRCAAAISIMPFATTAHAQAQVEVNLATEEATAGLQMEVVLPEGATLNNVRTTDALSPFSTRIAYLGNGRYRVLVVSNDGREIEVGTQNNILLDITMGDMPADKAQRMVRINNIVMASLEGTDMAISNARALFAEATGIEAVTDDDVIVRGGDDLRIESVKDGTVDVYNLAGVLVTRVKVTRGVTNINLPMGIYIVNGYKVTID